MSVRARDFINESLLRCKCNDCVGKDCYYSEGYCQVRKALIDLSGGNV